MKKMLLILMLLISFNGKGQQGALTLNDCYRLAEEHYPLARQKELIAASRDFSIDNAGKAYLPQISLGGQATYQSEVTGIPIKVPGVEIPTLTKDQYKVYGEVSQTVFDGGSVKRQKQILEANALADRQGIETELYKLRERINQLYFGILLINSQLVLVDIRKSDIRSGLDRTNGAIANGIAFKSSGDVLKAELLTADQAIIEQKAVRRGYLDMLGLFIGTELSDETILQEPQDASIDVSEITRPELLGFQYRRQILDLNEQMLSLRTTPKVSLFLQGGYGKPGLNLLKNEFSLYGLGGVRFNWLLSGFYTSKNDRLLIEASRRAIDIQKDVFLFNASLSVKQESAEVAKFRELIRTDEEIILLKSAIKNTSNAQLANGVKLPADYVRDVNAESLARQNQILHKIQFLSTLQRLKTIQGN